MKLASVHIMETKYVEEHGHVNKANTTENLTLQELIVISPLLISTFNGKFKIKNQKNSTLVSIFTVE